MFGQIAISGTPDPQFSRSPKISYFPAPGTLKSSEKDEKCEISKRSQKLTPLPIFAIGTPKCAQLTLLSIPFKKMPICALWTPVTPENVENFGLQHLGAAA